MVRWRPTLSARLASLVWIAAAAVAAAPAAFAAGEDTGTAGPTFKEGDVISFDKVESSKKFVPAEFWANRDFFFYEGMKMEIGPSFKDYTNAPEYLAATAKFKGQAKIGPDESSRTTRRASPFDPASIDCKGDPQAGTKLIWNFAYQWDGDGSDTHYFYSYWDRGEELPLYYEGTSKTIMLSHRVEPELVEKQDGDMFRGEKRINAFGIEVDAPFDARGIMLMTYRYKDSEKPPAQAKNDDTWVYVPTLRRVRRISTAQRTDAMSGTDFTLDDLFSFSGIVPQYTWNCLGEMDVLAPFNTKVAAYPYAKDHNFGPYGLSFADDRWELRHAVKIRMKPKNADHPYHHKDIYIDKQTYVPALLLRLRPEGRALEDHLAQPSLERGQHDQEVRRGELVPAVGRHPEAGRRARRIGHHRERADRHRQPHRVLGQHRHAVHQQGRRDRGRQGPPLHRRRPPDQGPLSADDSFEREAGTATSRPLCFHPST